MQNATSEQLPRALAELRLPTKRAAALIGRSADALRLARRSKPRLQHMPPWERISSRASVYRVADLVQWLAERGESPRWHALPAWRALPPS